VAGAAERQNYVAGAIRTEGAYTDNIRPATAANQISDETISIIPEFTFNRTMPRQHTTLTFSPAFTFYRNTTELNAMDQSANATFERRMSPHIAIGFQDYFVRTSNVFNTPFPFTAGGLAGNAQTPVPAVIAPFTEQIRNVANANLSYQFSSKGMIGGGGEFANYKFPNRAQAPGLIDSDSFGGNVFYQRRISHSQNVGLMYQYARIMSYPTNSKVQSQINTALPFYILSFTRRFSVSIAAGAQRTDVTQTQRPTYRSWSPAAFASFGWQGDRGNLAATYLHTSIAGQGLLGAFHSDGTNLAGGWRFARSWNGATAFSYQNTSVVSPLIALAYGGGKSITAMVSVEHLIGERLSVVGGYERLHEEFNGLAVVAANPDANREFVRISYTFTKSLGR